MGGPVVAVLDEDYTLFRELECIADADGRARNRRQEQQNKASRKGASRRRR